MIASALDFILQTILGLFTLALLMRFYLQLTGAPFQNPFSQSMIALTNFVVKPLRRVVPGWRGMDTSSLLAAYATQFLLLLLSTLLKDFPLMVAGSGVWFALVGLAAVEIARLSIYIFLYAVIAQAILSWISPYNMLSGVLEALTRPILQPVRNNIPSVSGFDFSPIVVFILAQLLLMLLIMPIEQALGKLY